MVNIILSIVNYQEKPEVIDLTIYTMVMDNDEVHKREGAQPCPSQKFISVDFIDIIFSLFN